MKLIIACLFLGLVSCASHHQTQDRHVANSIQKIQFNCEPGNLPESEKIFEIEVSNMQLHATAGGQGLSMSGDASVSISDSAQEVLVLPVKGRYFFAESKEARKKYIIELENGESYEFRSTPNDWYQVTSKTYRSELCQKVKNKSRS